MADEGRFDVAKPESFGSKDNKEIDNDAIDLSDERTFLPRPLLRTPC
jgi:hypothetical protein